MGENESISNGERRKGRPTGTVSNLYDAILKMSLYQMARGGREDLPELYQTSTTQFENESISNGERRRGRPTGTVSNIATSMNQQHYTTIHYTTTNLTSNTIT